MLTDEEHPTSSPVVAAAPSLASDLSWLLCMAARPTLQARYPKLAEMFNGREQLVDSVRSFWDDASWELGFTEMQVLAHHAGALTETDPGRLWLALEQAVATVPLDLQIPSESPEERTIFLDRIRRLRESPKLLASYLELLRELWEPVNDMWQQALPIMEEAARHLIAQFHTYFGMAPKTIARIRRFNLALEAINRVGRRDPLSYPDGKPYLDFQAGGAVCTATKVAIRWADLALDCGYYDQSHFINEFKSFSGLSPLEFLRLTRHY